MSELQNIPNSFEETLKDSDLQSVSIDIAETFFDTLFNDGILKDIPIIGAIVGLGKATFKISDRLFLKKIIYFITEIKDIPAKKREAFITEIDESETYRIKVGEKLLYIIDKCDDHEKSQIIGKLFKAFLLEKIDYDLFLRCSLVVEKAMLDDLDFFVRYDWEELTIEDAGLYLNWGIYEIAPLSIEMKERRNYQYNDEPRTYELEGGELKAKITFVGKKLREALRT